MAQGPWPAKSSGHPSATQCQVQHFQTFEPLPWVPRFLSTLFRAKLVANLGNHWRLKSAENSRSALLGPGSPDIVRQGDEDLVIPQSELASVCGPSGCR